MSKCPFFGFMDSLFALLKLALLLGIAGALFGWWGVVGMVALLLSLTLWDWFDTSGLRRKLGFTDRL